MKTPRFSVPQELTGAYHSFHLEVQMTGECGICYEEFELSQTVARLDCLCVYHQTCIKKWYKSKGEKRLSSSRRRFVFPWSHLVVAWELFVYYFIIYCGGGGV